MDALSSVLRSFRLRASFYAAWDLGAPWGLAFRPAKFAPFHYVESGAAWLVTRDGRRLELARGDAVVVFDGAGHRVCDDPASAAEPIERVVARQRHASVMQHGGAGRTTRLICGKFVADERDAGAAVLRQLPAVVHLRRETTPPAVRQLLELLASELRGGLAGATHAATLLTEALFVHVVRSVLATPEPPIGWLAALHDPPIAAALAAIHDEADRPWTLATLARRAGLSRSVFAERFHARVGATPVAYLARWRLQIAARWLRETALPVSEIYHRLGYGSAAAFHRAFKRAHGVAPTAYRARQ